MHPTENLQYVSFLSSFSSVHNPPSLHLPRTTRPFRCSGGRRQVTSAINLTDLLGEFSELAEIYSIVEFNYAMVAIENISNKKHMKSGPP